MKIAFIGAGNMATGLGKHWAAKGHELFFSHSRDNHYKHGVAGWPQNDPPRP